MKKTISMLLALAVSVSGSLAFAQILPQEEQKQDSQLFNHLSLGIHVLSTDGVGAQLAMPIGKHVQVRAGYTTHEALFSLANTALSKWVEVDGVNGFNPIVYTFEDVDMNFDSEGIHIKDITLEGNMQSNNAELLFDLFPGKKSGFHFTVGSYFNFCPDGFVTAKGTPTNELGQPSIPAGSRGTLEVVGLTSDMDGNLNLSVQWANKVIRPYAGIGFGRPVSLKHRVGLAFDLGVVYTGGAQLVGQNYREGIIAGTNAPKDVVLDAQWFEDVFLADPDVQENDDIMKHADDIKDALKKSNLYSQLYPVFKFTLFVRLF